MRRNLLFALPGLVPLFLGVAAAMGPGQKVEAEFTMTKVVLTSQGVVEVSVTNETSVELTVSMNVWGGNQCPDFTLVSGEILVTPSSGPTSCEERSAPGASITLAAGKSGTLSVDLEVGAGEYLVLVDAWASTRGSTSRTTRGVAVGVVGGGS